jgi:hypothetical protein
MQGWDLGPLISIVFGLDEQGLTKQFGLLHHEVQLHPGWFDAHTLLPCLIGIPAS